MVEDEPLIQLSAAEQLQELGFSVEIAGSATEAMNKLKLIKGAVDAAIVDIRLPDRTGDLLINEIRAIYPAIPIVIASGHAAEVVRERFNQFGKIAFVSKPYTVHNLRSALSLLKAIGK